MPVEEVKQKIAPGLYHVVDNNARAGSALFWGSGHPNSMQRNCCWGSWSPDLPPSSWLAASQVKQSRRRTQVNQSGPSGGDGSSGPSGCDGISGPSGGNCSSGPSEGELGRGTPGHGGGSGSSTSPSYPATGGSTGDAEQQAIPGDVEQQATPGDAWQASGRSEAGILGWSKAGEEQSFPWRWRQNQQVFTLCWWR
ncbi:UNVERIFIED_CONTAM: hypothetical protein FKN15_064455 [Acipenser sinensis]